MVGGDLSIRTLLLGVLPVLVIVSLACGGGETTTRSVPIAPTAEPSTGGPAESVFARVIVQEVELSADGEIVESITVRTDDKRELTLRLSDDIDPAIWGPRHLLGHVQASESFGIKIGVRYVQTADGKTVIELSE